MEKVELIRQIPLFRDLVDEDIQKLAEVATEESFTASSQIFAEGTKGDALFVVKYGTVQVLKRGRDGKEEVSRMGPGQHFGEMAIIDDDTRSATVEVAENTGLIRIKRDDLENLLAQDDTLAHRVYKGLTKYLIRRLRQTTTDLTFMREVAKQRRGQ
jgi:CRP-like cAMP-binding protein